MLNLKFYKTLLRPVLLKKNKHKRSDDIDRIECTRYHPVGYSIDKVGTHMWHGREKFVCHSEYLIILIINLEAIATMHEFYK